MARKPSKNLTERELEIMRVLWSSPGARLGEIQEALNRRGEPVAPSTVATQLNLLIHKGYVAQSGRPGRSVYGPTCSREDATKNLLDEFLKRLGLGRAPGFLIQMLRNERLSAEDRAALQELLRENPAESPRQPRSRPGLPPARGEENP
jgi:predicted transcriptional regulator